MKYDFNSIENLVLVRSTLRKLVKKISYLHGVIATQSSINDIPTKLKEFLLIIDDYKNSEDFKLLTEYIDAVHCPNFFRQIDKDFFEALAKENYTLQDILSILKKISLMRSEVEQEIININEKYF